MKKKKAIIIKNPLLQTLRNNLREIILDAFYRELHKLSVKERSIWEGKSVNELSKVENDEFHDLIDRQNKLREAKNRSICECPVWSQTNKDMIYNPKTQYWYCLDCYNELPKSLTPDWQPEYPLSTDQLELFIDELKRFANKCRTDHKISKRILKRMGFNETDQNKFLDICKEYGGYCDCEILMNAYQHILADYAKKGFRLHQNAF